jgi:hypothetical protein
LNPRSTAYEAVALPLGHGGSYYMSVEFHYLEHIALGWLSTLVERWSHNPKVASSILAPGTFFCNTRR